MVHCHQGSVTCSTHLFQRCLIPLYHLGIWLNLQRNEVLSSTNCSFVSFPAGSYTLLTAGRNWGPTVLLWLAPPSSEQNLFRFPLCRKTLFFCIQSVNRKLASPLEKKKMASMASLYNFVKVLKGRGKLATMFLVNLSQCYSSEDSHWES